MSASYRSAISTSFGFTLRKFLSLPVVLALVAVLGTAFWVFIGRGFLGVPGQWGEEPNKSAWPWGAWPLPIGVLVIFGGGTALSIYDRFRRAKNRKEQRNSIYTALAALMILNMLWPWSLLGPGAIPQPAAPGKPVKITLEGRFNIIAALWSDVATEYFGTAYRITDARQFAREYADRWQQPPSTSVAHVATHPPGAVLFFYGVRVLTESVPPLADSLNSLAVTMTQMKPDELYKSANDLRISSSVSGGVTNPIPLPPNAVGAALLSAFLLNFVLAISIPAVYGLAAMGAKDEAQGDTRGLIAASLFVLAPTLNLFTFTLDALIAGGVIWSLWCAARTLNGGSRHWLIASGVLMGLTVFVSIGALASVLIIAIACFLKRRNTLLQDAGLWLAGFLGIWLVICLAFPFPPVAVIRNAMRAHHNATLLYRAWLPWVPLNIIMWALFCGWPLVISLVESVRGGFKRNASVALPESGAVTVRENPTHIPAWGIGLAALAVLLLLSVSGNVRGEVERLWLFLLAPLCVLGALRLNWRLAAPLIILQAVQTILMAATLAPLVRPF